MDTKARVAPNQDTINTACEIALEQLGTVTTVGVKNMLRSAGFYATQNMVSNGVERWAKSTGRVWNDVATFANGKEYVHRVYRDPDTPGEPPKSMHQQPPVPKSDASPKGISFNELWEGFALIGTIINESDGEDDDITEVKFQ